MGMRLLLIRHGQTPSNVLGALDTLVPGPGLTTLGHEQAAAIPAALAAENIGAIYASVQQRAQLTAAPLADSLGLAVTIRDGLREIAAGDLEMNRDRASVDLYHETSFGWSSGDLGRRMPGAESGEEVFARFDAVINEVDALGEGTVACVAHGQIIRSWVAARTPNVSPDFALQHELHNTGVIVVEGSVSGGWTTVDWAGIAIGGVLLDDGAATGPGGSSL